MWRILIITLLAFQALGQEEPSSFFFEEPVPVGNRLMHFDSSLIGNYPSEEEPGKVLIVEEKIVKIRYLILMDVTLDEVKANGAWYLSEGEIFGIKKGEGLPYIERNDTFFFAVPLINNWLDLDQDYLVRNGDYWFIFSPEGSDGWTLKLLEDTPAGIRLLEFDHELVLEGVKSWSGLRTEMLKEGTLVYSARPGTHEFLKVMRNGLLEIGKYKIVE